MLAALVAVAALAAGPSIPWAFRGKWDLPGQCRMANSDARLIVRERDMVFVELVFTPKRILKSEAADLVADGEFNEEGMAEQGNLSLRLSRSGQRISYRNHDNRVVRLNRCPQK